jgi:hypothetical protein
MHATHYESFLVELRRRLEADPRVQGLVLLGSTADPSLRDDLSDHDFWVIAETAALPDYMDAGADVLLQLLARAQVLAIGAGADRLDARRRLEQRAPDDAAALSRILALPPHDAIALVRLAEQSLPRDLLVSASGRVDPIRTWLAAA